MPTRSTRPTRGTRRRGEPPAPATAAASFDAWCAAHLAERAVVRRSTRGDGGTVQAADLAAPHRVLEVHFADGSTLYTDPRSFVETYADGAVSRGGAPAGRIELPFDLGTTSARRQRAGGGAGPAAIDRYALSELTDPTALDRVYDLAESVRRTVLRLVPGGRDAKAAERAARLCAAYEASSLDAAVGAGGGALLAWDQQRWVPVPPGSTITTGGRPALLFLHGTASSTEGSLGALWAAAPDGRRAADFERLAQSHRLLAWEHRTLTLSPVDNAIGCLGALLDALPEAGRLDVVSHSRGGLVGELLALRSADALAGAQPAFAQVFAAADHPDAERIATLFERLARAGERWRGGTFVRVACPARGTLLADGRTDLFLSVLLRAVGLATSGLATVVVERLARFVSALVAARADARSVPGLEAMIPGSALTRALAACDARPAERLRVVAGDAVARGLSGLLTLIADVFYGWHDHDYVVHTRSMFGGLKRAGVEPRSLRWAHPAVSHFAYFGADRASRAALMAALAGRDDGFEPLADDEEKTRTGSRGPLQALKANPLARRTFDDWRRLVATPGRPRKPVLVVLAGIMGSELKRRDASPDEPVWLSMRSMLGGRLRDLELDAADTLEASGLLAVSYERLLERAQPRFDALAVPYDWRRPIAASGEALRQRLADVLAAIDDAAVPVHVIAHSMGGLVARHALFHDDGALALWQRLKRRGGRLLMLGTPHAGSYAPAQLLLRQHAMAQLLGLFSARVSGSDIARFGAAFPGLLQMLPQAADETFGDLFDDRTWQGVARADARTIVPERETLRLAREYVRDAAFARSLAAMRRDERALYVAGVGTTPLAMRVRPDPWRETPGGDTVPAAGVEFVGAVEGDGTVPWTSTLDPERTWYARCEHGTLADHTASFDAYFELLEDGSTRRLERQPPRQRAGERAPVPLPPRPALLPVGDDELAAYALQLEGDATEEPARPEPITVRLVHGGLDYASFPLMVGHYQNEPLTGAARRVDEKLGGQLQCVLDLKLFVGASRTAHYLRPNNHAAEPPSYPGAVVLGLGTIGELTPGNLAETVARGVLRYAFEHLHRDPWSPGADAPVDLRLSSVLVGTRVQAVTIRDSLAGLLRGLWQAAVLVGRLGCPARPVRVRELEIVEIDEHTALDTAYELQRLLERGDWRERFRWLTGVLEVREGHLTGYRPRSSASAWQRLVVRHDATTGGMDFALIGSHARVEATQVYADVAVLRGFIDRITDERPEAGDTASIARATDPRLGHVLHQLLLPHHLKGRLANLDNTVLVLDDETATYPWELIAAPGDGAEGPRPIAVHAGLVRQRLTQEFRQLPQHHTRFHALVVGAPATDGWHGPDGRPLAFGDLPGARAEAELVARLLGDDRRGWEVKPLIGSAPGTDGARRLGFERVRVALVERPYRLLHLCGHGVVDQWVRQVGSGADARAVRKTGMVLSNQDLLGAADVEQMGVTPEFVFINCCYSGRDGTADAGDDPALRRQRAALASSLALKFIDMGARAVVAAGWQVDDEAALLFAQAFYEQLLAGVPFGEAVRDARRKVYDTHGRATNTWGAYQCYGDPSWSLADSGADPRAGGETSRLRGAERALSARELASRIAQVEALAGDEPAAVVVRRLDGVVAAVAADPVRRDWVRDSRVRAALARAYRELGEHRKAAEYLQRGACTAYSEVAIGQLDALVNSLARVGDDQATAAALSWLEVLDQLCSDASAARPLTDDRQPEPSAKSERLCLRGSIRLRSAARLLEANESEPEVLDALRHAAEDFGAGFRAKLKEGDRLERRTYALSNALLAAALLQMLDDDPGAGLAALGSPDAAEAPVADAATQSARWVAQADRHLEQLSRIEHGVTFWQHATAVELRTARGLLAHVVDHPGYTRETVAADIAHVRRQIERVMTLWPSPLQVESMRLRFRLIKAVVARCRGRKAADASQRELLDEIDALAHEALARLHDGRGEVG